MARPTTPSAMPDNAATRFQPVADHLTRAAESLSMVDAGVDDAEAAQLREALAHVLEAEAILRDNEARQRAEDGEGEAFGFF